MLELTLFPPKIHLAQELNKFVHDHVAQHKRRRDGVIFIDEVLKRERQDFATIIERGGSPRSNGSNSIQMKVIDFFFLPFPSYIPVRQKGSVIANLTMKPLYENHN